MHSIDQVWDGVIDTRNVSGKSDDLVLLHALIFMALDQIIRLLLFSVDFLIENGCQFSHSWQAVGATFLMGLGDFHVTFL